MAIESDRRIGTGPMLSDGTLLRDLIDLERREVSMRVLSDPEIYRLELDKIFARSWVGVGHEAEIPNAGDFVLRYIGEDPVIVTRTANGEISILLNVCSHRGMEVCWADSGNSSTFKCPYHGWTFDGDGQVVGTPFEREMYGDWDKSEYGLTRARVGLHHGRIFGNFDPQAVSLEEWLGEAAWYIDADYLDGEPEMELCGALRRFKVNANWKISADNNSGDNYHGLSLHKSLLDLGFGPPDRRLAMDVVKVSTSMGHGLVGFNKNIMSGDLTYNPEDPAYYKYENYQFTVMMFPATFGLGGSANNHVPGPDGQPILIVNIGGLVPVAPDRFELWLGVLVEKRAPEAIKAMMRKPTLLDIGGVDDMESWPSVQRAARGSLGRRQTLKYNSHSGVRKPEGWPGPGLVYAGFSQDDSQWNFWLRWLELMTAGEN